jgi:hypothetical protein
VEEVEEDGGGGGWRAWKAGIMMKKRRTTSGRMTRRYGSRHTNTYTLRKERVCVGFFHVKRRIARFWKTNTMPILQRVSFGTGF